MNHVHIHISDQRSNKHSYLYIFWKTSPLRMPVAHAHIINTHFVRMVFPKQMRQNQRVEWQYPCFLFIISDLNFNHGRFIHPARHYLDTVNVFSTFTYAATEKAYRFGLNSPARARERARMIESHGEMLCTDAVRTFRPTKYLTRLLSH